MVSTPRATALVPMVVVMAVAPVPLISPERVIVSFPVKYPASFIKLRFEAVVLANVSPVRIAFNSAIVSMSVFLVNAEQVFVSPIVVTAVPAEQEAG